MIIIITIGYDIKEEGEPFSIFGIPVLRYHFYHLNKMAAKFFLIIYSLAVTDTILITYVSHPGGERPKFITRDIRLFIIFIFGVLNPLYSSSIIIALLIIGVLSHIGVLYSIIYNSIK